MYRLQKLEVRQFRGLSAPVTFTFGPRYHLVVGDNGAGKTNLLKLIAMVTRLDFSALAGESFDIGWAGGTHEGARIEGEVKRTVLPMTEEGFRAGVLPVERVSWEFKIDVTAPGEAPLLLAGAGPDDGPMAKGDPTATMWRLEIWMMLFDRLRDLGLLSLLAGSFRTDEALGTFNALATGAGVAYELQGFSPLIRIDKEQAVQVWALPTTPPVLAWAQQVANGQAPPLGDRELPWLATVTVDLGAQKVELRPAREERRPSGADGTSITFTGADLYIDFSPRLRVHHDKLSFGQKRLIALRYYLSTIPSAPAIIDELSNGLHHAWTASILKDLEDHQSFLATQNPLVMDGVWWDSAEEAGRGILLCTRDAEHGWTWRQLDAEESVRFYEAWRAGIQQIHEVLKTERWW